MEQKEDSMRKKVLRITGIYIAVMCMLFLGGCSGSQGRENGQAVQNKTGSGQGSKDEKTQRQKQLEDEQPGQQDVNAKQKTGEGLSGEDAGKTEPELVETDWSEYFHGMNGAAVIYDASRMQQAVFAKKTAMTRRSPCSTFKIISSLTALELGIINPEHSLRSWSGEVFWNESWNRDKDFQSAFRDSCVWYFRKVTDEIGPQAMKEAVDKLSYGNHDISDWEGRLNTNNSNPALTGFWIESSLKISPIEQTEVLERIFGKASAYSQASLDALREVMLLAEEQNQTGIPIYGKTGMGVEHGVTVDAWFSGFAEQEGRTIYFCVYLGRTDGMDVTSAAAREIAIQLVSDYI